MSFSISKGGVELQLVMQKEAILFLLRVESAVGALLKTVYVEYAAGGLDGVHDPSPGVVQTSVPLRLMLATSPGAPMCSVPSSEVRSGSGVSGVEVPGVGVVAGAAAAASAACARGRDGQRERKRRGTRGKRPKRGNQRGGQGRNCRERAARTRGNKKSSCSVPGLTRRAAASGDHAAGRCRMPAPQASCARRVPMLGGNSAGIPDIGWENDTRTAKNVRRGGDSLPALDRMRVPRLPYTRNKPCEVVMSVAVTTSLRFRSLRPLAPARGGVVADGSFGMASSSRAWWRRVLRVKGVARA